MSTYMGYKLPEISLNCDIESSCFEGCFVDQYGNVYKSGDKENMFVGKWSSLIDTEREIVKSHELSYPPAD